MNMFEDGRWKKIRLIARGIGASDHQLKKWQELQRIPHTWHVRLLIACKEQRVRLSTVELLRQQQEGGESK